jgi:hypothetical protein
LSCGEEVQQPPGNSFNGCASHRPLTHPPARLLAERGEDAAR